MVKDQGLRHLVAQRCEDYKFRVWGKDSIPFVSNNSAKGIKGVGVST